MLMTMSSSVAPSAMRPLRLEDLGRGEVAPCGKPMTVPTATSVPAQHARASATSAGRAHTEATW